MPNTNSFNDAPSLPLTPPTKNPRPTQPLYPSLTVQHIVLITSCSPLPPYAPPSPAPSPPHDPILLSFHSPPIAHVYALSYSNYPVPSISVPLDERDYWRIAWEAFRVLCLASCFRGMHFSWIRERREEVGNGKEDERHDCLVCSFRFGVVAVFN